MHGTLLGCLPPLPAGAGACMNQHVLVFKTSNKYRMVIGSNGGQSYEYITQDRNTTLGLCLDEAVKFLEAY